MQSEVSLTTAVLLDLFSKAKGFCCVIARIAGSIPLRALCPTLLIFGCCAGSGMCDGLNAGSWDCYGLCGYVVVWLCGCVVMWLCGCLVVWLCVFVWSRDINSEVA